APLLRMVPPPWSCPSRMPGIVVTDQPIRPDTRLDGHRPFSMTRSSALDRSQGSSRLTAGASYEGKRAKEDHLISPALQLCRGLTASSRVAAHQRHPAAALDPPGPPRGDWGRGSQGSLLLGRLRLLHPFALV